ncbi:MAG TPA: ATP synthase subunit [Desulfovibrio sp.]|jgi:ATP synthase protein I|nr:ATP synthase subunit [Desulfovibrio sp.]
MFFNNWFKINDKKYLDAISTAGVIGLHMVSSTVVGLAMGWYLDRWLGTKPWLTGVFLILGIVAGFKNVWLDSRRLLKAQDKEDAEKFGPKDR